MIIQEGKSLSGDDRILLQWAEESKKENIAQANDVLAKVLTASTTIVGGGVIFLNENIIHGYLIAVILITFLLAVALALYGIMPYQATVNIKSPTEIKDYKEQALKHKLKYIKMSSLCFIIGLLLASIGVAYKQIQTHNNKSANCVNLPDLTSR